MTALLTRVHGPEEQTLRDLDAKASDKNVQGGNKRRTPSAAAIAIC